MFKFYHVDFRKSIILKSAFTLGKLRSALEIRKSKKEESIPIKIACNLQESLVKYILEEGEKNGTISMP